MFSYSTENGQKDPFVLMNHHHGFFAVLMSEGMATFSLVTLLGTERWQHVSAATLSAMIPEASQMDGVI